MPKKTTKMIESKCLLLDTHVWFRHQITPDRLRSGVQEIIDGAAQRFEVFVSVISIWEFAMLERDGHLKLQGGIAHWSREALAKPGIALLPLSPAIAIESVALPEPMHRDPSDRFLVASARIENMTLVTSDKAIIRFAKTTGLSYLRA